MSKKTIIPIGPYHPLQEEPEFFKLHVDGETVVKVDIELGYNHRGVEKLAESKTFEQAVYFVERICGICSTSHPIACCQAIEDAGEVKVPERALYIRSIIGELERLHSHLLWLGLAGHFLGFNTVWMWVWRYREDVINCLEIITGNRNHYCMMKPGGVRRDIKGEDIPTILGVLNGLKKPLDLFYKTVNQDPVLQARTRNVGILTRQNIIDYCGVGPLARASGVAIDVRKDHPHAAYGMVDFKVITTTKGDVFDKVDVRILEMFESVSIIKQCLEALKKTPGPIDANPAVIKAGDGIGHYEAPRGEVIHYIRSDGSNRPARHKIRAPSYVNVATNRTAVVGQSIADATIILGAVDPCYCCTERMAAIRVDNGEKTLTADDLIKLSWDKTSRLRKELGAAGPVLPLD
ncbi:MAG: nickel-dependent hydrogenase large subunit [Chitinivibrionales bacterium]|nr:nickel-dependent hydrogenase large subunit [Chitinivibrionales bacterium]